MSNWGPPVTTWEIIWTSWALQCIYRTAGSRLQFVTFPHYLGHKVLLLLEADKVSFGVKYRLAESLLWFRTCTDLKKVPHNSTLLPNGKKSQTIPYLDLLAKVTGYSKFEPTLMSVQGKLTFELKKI